jgi:hypothetical protein
MDIRAVDLNLLKAFDRAVLELLDEATAGRRQQAQSRIRRLASERPRKWPDQRDLRVFGHAGGEGRRARSRVEADAEAQRRLDMLDCRGDQRRDLARPRGRFHPDRGAYEEFVGEKTPEARQGVAHRRLRQADAAGGAGHRALGHQRIDVAVAFVGNLPAHIDATVLLRDPFVVVARQDHPAAAGPMSLEAYAAQNHVLVSPRGTTTGALDRILVDFGLKRRIALLIATYLAVPAALARSDLIATVPRRVAEQIAANAEIAITPLPIDFATTVSMAWHRRAAGDPAQSWFRALLTDAAAIE